MHSSPDALKTICGLTHLRSLLIECNIGIDNCNGYWPTRMLKHQSQLTQVVKSNISTLRHFTAFGPCVRMLDEKTCGNISQLDIWGAEDDDMLYLASMFPYMVELRSLSITELTSHSIYGLLRWHRDHFSQLRSLKLMFLEPDPSEKDMGDLVEFLHCTPNLERFDLDQPGIPTDTLLALLTIIRDELPRLVALGIDLRTLADSEDLERVAKYIPSKIEALHIQLRFENLPLDSEGMGELVSPFSQVQ